MSEKQRQESVKFNRRGFLQSLGALMATTAVGCGQEKASTDSPKGESAEGKGQGVGDAPKASEVSKLAGFRQDNRLRLSLTEMAHFADRSREGLLAIPLGTVAARKYTNGGWRSGWSVKLFGEGKDAYAEADSKSARVFFKHDKGGFDRIIVRMKAVKKSNTVTFYVNDEAISTTDIDSSWKDYTVEVPLNATRDGENQLMLRFKYDTKEAGRTQAAHVSAVHVMPKGAKIEDAPSGPPVQKVTFGGLAFDALVASSPQTYGYLLEVPVESPKLAVAFGAKAAGVKFSISAVSDKTPKKSLMEKSAEAAGRWQEEIVDLSGFAGQVVELTLTVSGQFGAEQVAAWGQPAIHSEGVKAAPAAGKEARNVLVYLIDTMRYDKFSFYNDKTNCSTPKIDAFAKEATVFDAAYDNENWTKPSTATILTGLYPDTHKAKEDTSKLPADAKMISQHFKSKGFKTGSFLANGYVSDAFGFKKGWDHYTNYIREERNTDADNVVKETLNWIETVKGERFFAYVHTIDPHVPYSPPQAWREKYWKKEYTGPIKPQATGDQLAEIKTGKLEVSREDKNYLEALYNGETSFNDDCFGTLVQGLKDKGLYDNTVIVIIADHGEEFWDHGSVGHGHSLYEELVHSPLLVRHPTMTTAGRRIPHVVSMVDLAPSLFAMTGVESHDAVEGKSWTDTFDGIGDPHPRIAVSDFLYRKKAVRVGPYKWHTIGRGGELFNVVEDRDEKRDLINKESIGRAYVRSVFGLFYGAGNKTAWWEAAEKAGPALELKPDNVEAIDADTAKMLEAMGYVDGAKGEVNAAEDKKKMKEEDN